VQLGADLLSLGRTRLVQYHYSVRPGLTGRISVAHGPVCVAQVVLNCGVQAVVTGFVVEVYGPLITGKRFLELTELMTGIAEAV
jgi:hypothetical protein